MNYNPPNYRTPDQGSSGQPTPGDVFGGSTSISKSSVGQPLLSGTYGEVEVPIAPAPVPGGGRAIWVAAIIGALTLLVGGGFLALQAFSAQGGADTPEAAMDMLIEALNNEDVITFGELLEPAERRTVIDPMLDDVLPELIRLGVVSEDFDASSLAGVDLTLTDVTYRIDPIAGHPDMVHGYFTGGTASSSVTAAELPLGDAIVSRFGDQMQDSSEPTEAIDGSEGMPVTFVERDGRWYVSMWFTLAEIARIEFGEDLPLLSAQPVALGSSSPEAAVEAIVDEIVELDVDGMIGRLDPSEMAALYRYSPLFLDEARSELRSARDTARSAGVSWDVTDMGFDVDADGDDAVVTIRSFTASVVTEEFSATVVYGPELITARVTGMIDGERIDGRLELAPRRWSVTGTFGTESLDATVVIDADADRITLDGQVSGEPFEAELNLDSSSSCSRYRLEGFDQAESGCLEDFGALGSGGGAELLRFVDQVGDEFPGVPVVAHRTEGAWYVSPTGTVMHGVAEGLRGLEQQAFDDFLDQVVMSTRGPGLLGAVAGVPFGFGVDDDFLLTDPTTTFDDIDDSLFDDFVVPPSVANDREIHVSMPSGTAIAYDGEVANGERSVYLLYLEEGQSVGVTLFGSDLVDGGIGDPYLEVQTPNGEWFVQNDDNEGLNSGLQFTADRAGEWRIVAADLNSFAGAYELTLEIADPGSSPSIGESLTTGFGSDFGADIEDVIVLDLDRSKATAYSGSLSSGSFDLFEIELLAGDQVVVTAVAEGDSGLDTRLVLLGPAENTMAENDDAPSDAGLGLFDSQLTVTAAEAGVHMIEMHSFGDLGEGSYTLTVTRS